MKLRKGQGTMVELYQRLNLAKSTVHNIMQQGEFLRAFPGLLMTDYFTVTHLRTCMDKVVAYLARLSEGERAIFNRSNAIKIAASSGFTLEALESHTSIMSRIRAHCFINPVMYVNFSTLPVRDRPTIAGLIKARRGQDVDAKACLML